MINTMKKYIFIFVGFILHSTWHSCSRSFHIQESWLYLFYQGYCSCCWRLDWWELFKLIWSEAFEWWNPCWWFIFSLTQEAAQELCTCVLLYQFQRFGFRVRDWDGFAEMLRFGETGGILSGERPFGAVGWFLFGIKWLFMGRLYGWQFQFEFGHK